MRSVESRLVVLFVLLVMLCTSSSSSAREKKSRSEDLAKVVALAHQLESEPLGDDAVAARAWLAKFIDKAPDVTVVVCPLLGPIPADDHPYSSEIMLQMLFSNAAYQIEHPGEADNTLATQVAGVEGSIKVYEAVLKRDEKARLEYFDELIRKRDRGELAESLRREVGEKCKS